MRNYDTRDSQVFVRTPQAQITKDKRNNLDIIYTEVMAIIDGDDKLQHLDNVGVQRRMDLSKITEPVPCRDLVTDEPTGEMVTSEQLKMILHAFIRADQDRVDAESAAS